MTEHDPKQVVDRNIAAINREISRGTWPTNSPTSSSQEPTPSDGDAERPDSPDRKDRHAPYGIHPEHQGRLIASEHVYLDQLELMGQLSDQGATGLT